MKTDPPSEFRKEEIQKEREDFLFERELGKKRLGKKNKQWEEEEIEKEEEQIFIREGIFVI